MEEGSGPQSENMDLTVVYYDSLDAMLMGLNAGEIDSMEIYQSVGNLVEQFCRLNHAGTCNILYFVLHMKSEYSNVQR